MGEELVARIDSPLTPGRAAARRMYDTIGGSYASRRRADPRIFAEIEAEIRSDATLLNVGAGAGSYELTRHRVVAVDPSMVMLAQRTATAAPAVQAIAEALPFYDQSFDVTLAILTMHHWSDLRRGLDECARVARERVVIFTWNPEAKGFWLVQNYFPEILEIDRRIFPSLQTLGAVLGKIEVKSVPIPGDCIDGFLGAFWRRPEAYLNSDVRGSISTFGRISNVNAQCESLKQDLETGAWDSQYGELRERAELDVGYCIVTADVSRS